LKIDFECSLCPENSPSIVVSVKDDGKYDLTCANGHKTQKVLCTTPYEILFQIAINAIIDGYYREAVSSFASSLERFYEYYVRITCYKHKIDHAVYEDCRKLVSQQSERQLGMFIMAFVLESKERPKLLPDDMTKFRNDVVHKGKIPTRDDAIKFGNAVLSVIAPVWNRVVSEKNHGYSEVIDEEYELATKKCKPGTEPMMLLSVGGLNHLRLIPDPSNKELFIPSFCVEEQIKSTERMRQIKVLFEDIKADFRQNQ